jgi:hypothetical protein
MRLCAVFLAIFLPAAVCGPGAGCFLLVPAAAEDVEAAFPDPEVTAAGDVAEAVDFEVEDPLALEDPVVPLSAF